MYPFIRGATAMIRARRQGPMGLLDVHENPIVVLPWDLDFWNELNNGRTLSLYDLGRVPLFWRSGLFQAAKREGLYFTVAGSTTRYRRRVQSWARLRMTNRVLCWDARFFYFEHAMWRADGECTSHALIRSAMTSGKGIEPTDRLLQALGYNGPIPEIPDWVAGWSASETQRPWPPMQDALA
ncbi:MAG: acyl-CoA thioesterase [Paracoccaceae bacterium]